MRPLALALLFSLPAAGGCAQCSSAPDAAPDASSPAPVMPAPELLPAPALWTFAPKRDRHRGIALPEGCRTRAPMVQANVAQSSRFIALPHLLGTLVVADASGSPPELTGVAAVRLDPSGTASGPIALPWLAAAELPRLARTAGGTWLSTIGLKNAEAVWTVALWRNGATEWVGSGDRFEALDIQCSAQRCALLTTRLGKVAAAGADVWTGDPDQPVGAWKHIEIIPAAGDSNAYPLALASVAAPAKPPAAPTEALSTQPGTTSPAPSGQPSAAPAAPSGQPSAAVASAPVVNAGTAAGAPGVVATLLEKGDIVFFWADAPDGPRELARMPAPYGVIDATLMPEPVAMTYGAAPPAQPDASCLPEDGTIRFERAGQPLQQINVHAAPLGGSLRKLARGALATFIAPLGCHVARQVVYGVLVDPSGTPTSAPMPIGDATSYAVAARGDDVDLWVQHEDRVTWVRATCSVP